ncbi:MAG TPA: alpha-glucuronidase, partial [Spirochaetia bacterium]|nr:alpha-glucuronidase [Spirochaetia bacterium]
MDKHRQDYSPCWLARHPVSDTGIRDAWRARLRTLTVPPVPPGSVLETAIRELKGGLESLLGLRIRTGGPGAHRGMSLELTGMSVPGSYVLTVLPQGVRLTAPDGAGALYGVFDLLGQIAQGRVPTQGARSEVPHRQLRMVDHWDNLDGTVERGYAGSSLFFQGGKVLTPGPRTQAYARLCASVGINAVAINNVNVHGPETELITDRHLPRLARLAQVFRSWGIHLYLSVNFAAPLTLGDLDTADPLDPRVVAWWEARARQVWAAIPDLGGFLVKADSEGRPGPFTYGRDHTAGANLLARALSPFGGLVLWRCFVYNCLQDWRDRTTDRARAAFDTFQPLDGTFFPNVYLQVKNGPMDFQPREPVSPLFGAMAQTPLVLELQVTQEYLGQQRHLCFLPEQWRSYLDFPVGAGPDGGLSRRLGGMTAVANVGTDPNWTGHDL